MTANGSSERISTGIEGLDDILHGGLIENRSYLVTGNPGSGKTTLGLHFVCEQDSPNSEAVFITFGERSETIKQDAAARGFGLKNVNFVDLTPDTDELTDETYEVFFSEEVEHDPIIQKICKAVEERNPDRIYIDSITHYHLLFSDDYQSRKQIFILLEYLSKSGATILFTSEGSSTDHDDMLQFISDGVLELSFTGKKRSVAVTKFRGSNFKKGSHPLQLDEKGITIYPRIETHPVENRKFSSEQISSGVPEIDELLGGGLERGTSTIISGPTGTGKTTLGIQFMKEAAGRGEHSAVYTFEEETDTLIQRSNNINIPVSQMLERGTLRVESINSLFFTPEELGYEIGKRAQETGSSIVMLDSVSGYSIAYSDHEKDLIKNLHALTSYLKNIGVAVILTNETKSITGQFKATDVGLSYIADNIIFLMHLEVQGKLKKAIGVLKKRMSGFENTLRGFEITEYGVKVGRPLTNFRGILSGTPEIGDSEEE